MTKQDNKQQLRFDKQAVHPLQTWQWGKFRQEWGNKVIRTNFGQIIFSKIQFTKLTIGTFIKGPKPTLKMLKDLKKIGQEQKAIFIKLEPNHTAKTKQEKIKLMKLFKSNSCCDGKTLFTSTTFWIDLTKSEDELLKSFSAKTRYNIRHAQRKGVLIVETDKDKDFEKYIQLTRETVERQSFFAHSEKYHHLMWKYLHQLPVTRHQPPIAHLLTAKYKGETITAWIVFLWKNFLYYPYGASSEKYKNVMANNLMMWETIRFGKNKGCTTFDLWGREPGKGFTRFKEGYNPKVVEFLGTWDLIINPFLYWPYRIAESLRWSSLRVPAKLGLIKPKF